MTLKREVAAVVRAEVRQAAYVVEEELEEEQLEVAGAVLSDFRRV